MPLKKKKKKSINRLPYSQHKKSYAEVVVITALHARLDRGKIVFGDMLRSVGKVLPGRLKQIRG